MKSLEYAIDIQDLNFSFGEGENSKQVLFNNNLQIKPGEIVVMTGPSGSGKTTLLTLIGTLRSLQEGSILFNGTELKGLNNKQRQQIRKNIGFIFQAHNLFDSLTAFETMRLTMQLQQEKYSNSDYQKFPTDILSKLGLEERMHHKPSNLSGGQKGRVAIARALINTPQMILADEPTAALDKDTGRQVVNLFRKLANENKTTIFMVTHDNRILDVADRIVHMVDGNIEGNVLIKEQEEICLFLQKSSVFKNLKLSDLTSAIQNMGRETVQPGQTIIRQGEVGDKFYLILDGEAAVHIDTDGKPKKVGNLSKGDNFGELALINDAPRAATIIAQSEISLMTLDKQQFKDILEKSPSLEEELRNFQFSR